MKKEKRRSFILVLLFIIAAASIFICLSVGTVGFSLSDIMKGLCVADDSPERLLIWELRLPRILTASLVGICLSLSGCILQGVMRNNLASPSTIGVTGGASFMGYLTLVAFPSLSHLLPVGAILGAFLTTLFIYMLAYQKGASPVKMILSGLAVSALFGAFNDIIKTVFSENLVNASGFLVGGLNGVTWQEFKILFPYAVLGILFVIFLPARMNILMLGDEEANTLGLRCELFKFFLICLSSLLSGAAIAAAGLISFVGLIVPHISRLLVGSDYKYLFPASIFLGSSFMVICDSIGRVIMPPGEVPVSIILSFIGAPFFLYLLRKKDREGA